MSESSGGLGAYRRIGWIMAALSVGACTGSSTTGVEQDLGALAEISCSIPKSQIFNGGPGKDGIPALTNPSTVVPGASGTEYLNDGDRVMGLVVGDEVLAIPLNIMWWHEIVNLDLGGRRLAVTHCPLTGSSLVFDREPLGGVELGVSGLLFRNNLIMYDRSDQESLWPQMTRGARCGLRDGTDLAMYPLVEMTWQGWRTLHPETRVVSSETEFGRNYTVYPYGDYDRIDNPELLFPLVGIDPRRPPKERTLGVPAGEGGRAYPFGELTELGAVGVVDDGDLVVFWDGRAEAAMAFEPTLDGQRLGFEVRGEGIVDTQTGSVWQVDGVASSGPMAGRTLAAVPEAYVSYWFAWTEFQPNTSMWRAP